MIWWIAAFFVRPAALQQVPPRSSSGRSGSGRTTPGGTIIGQLRRLGCTLDYERERFTMDEAYADAVLHVFVDLYEKGYIYRDRYMVNWDPGLGSAISDLEVEEREVTDTLVSIAYPLSDGSGERSWWPRCAPRRCWATPPWR